MIDRQRLREALVSYKRDFPEFQWRNERYKWEAVQCFQRNWNESAQDFAGMLAKALSRTYNLLASVNYFPERMIVKFAKAAPERVRSMFLALFDENVEVWSRIEAFKAESAELLNDYGAGARQHYQYENAITVYLWLRYPDKYYIYKFGEIKAVAKELHSDCRFKKGDYAGNIRSFLRLYDEINEELKRDGELAEMLREQVTETCYPDPELCTLTVDVGFYISRYFIEASAAQKPVEGEASSQTEEAEQEAVSQSEEALVEGERGYWWLNANPRIWSLSEMPVGDVVSYSLYNESGRKRRIFQNFLDARAGDRFVGYESNPVKQVVTLGRISAAQDGERIYFEKTESLASPIDCRTLKECPELERMEFFRNPQGSLFRLTKEEYDAILDIVREENPAKREAAVEPYSKRDFLSDVYMSEQRYDQLAAVLKNRMNVILQGAPGVGKTYAARRLAWSLMGERDDSRIEFVQFHQSYSYEDFVMGYKPVDDGFALKYGTFYRFCQRAANQPDKDFFFIIDEINRGNLSKIFGELLMLIERGYREAKVTLAYSEIPFSVPGNLYIIGMMNTADRSLAMIDYALRRRFSFFEMEPGFDSGGFVRYQRSLNSPTLDELIDRMRELNREIAGDPSLGKGFCIGHSYFCACENCTDEWLRAVVDYDILPMLSEYWFDDAARYQRWENRLRGVFQ